MATLEAGGMLTAAKVSRLLVKAPLSWRLRNALRPSYLWGWLTTLVAKAFSWLTGIPTLTSELRAVLIRADGLQVDYGVVARRCITNAGVAYLVDAWDGRLVALENMNYHGCGTSNAAEAATDTALGAECTTVLNPASTRAAGTRSQPASNQLQTVGLLMFGGSATVQEHGLFNQAATGGGTLWDRSVHSAIAVVAGEGINYTYTLTVNSGT